MGLGLRLPRNTTFSRAQQDGRMREKGGRENGGLISGAPGRLARLICSQSCTAEKEVNSRAETNDSSQHSIFEGEDLRISENLAPIRSRELCSLLRLGAIKGME